MRVNGRAYRTIWRTPDGAIAFIDQRFLPHRFLIEEVRTVEALADAIREMHIRGAIALGAAAAYGMELAAASASDADLPTALARAAELLKQTRPTAVNIAWAVDSILKAVAGAQSAEELRHRLRTAVDALVEGEVERCRRIGEHGAALLETLAQRKATAPLQILTHCNAGWLGCVDYGTALAPVYVAADRGIPLHVWVSETRPRNQGAALTAWELQQHGVPYTVVVDSACGHLLQQGMVDVALVGADRITRRGDTANKIGTYPKALLCRAHGVPFYVAAPSSSFDPTLTNGTDIPLEERSPEEVHTASGLHGDRFVTVRITPDGARAWNPSFDVTPAELITGFLTEYGLFPATAEGVEDLLATAHVYP
ncbi:Methylthioribose-1-phosphate isomerase [bacterium HR21]|nr:Methylthioribose-1-phosphate isomerase [bacterium HR21]